MNETVPRGPFTSRRLNLITEVEETWIQGHMEYWVRFGRRAGESILDRRRRIVRFTPNSIFAFVQWSANDYGTINSRIDVLRAIWPGQSYTTVPFVRPGGEVLLHIEGWPKVEKVLLAIDVVEALGIDPADAAPDHWCHVHNRVSAGYMPRVYSLERHEAWLKRRDILS